MPVLVPVIVPVPVLAPMTTSISRPGSPTVFLSHYVSAPSTYVALSLPHHTLVSCRKISAPLLPLSMLDPPLPLGSSLSKIFKQSLSDEL